MLTGNVHCRTNFSSKMYHDEPKIKMYETKINMFMFVGKRVSNFLGLLPLLRNLSLHFLLAIKMFMFVHREDEFIFSRFTTLTKNYILTFFTNS